MFILHVQDVISMFTTRNTQLERIRTNALALKSQEALCMDLLQGDL